MLQTPSQLSACQSQKKESCLERKLDKECKKCGTKLKQHVSFSENNGRIKKNWAIQGPFCDSFIRKTAVEEIKKTIRKERARNGLNVVVLRSFQTTTIDTILKLPVLV